MPKIGDSRMSHGVLACEAGMSSVCPASPHHQARCLPVKAVLSLSFAAQAEWLLSEITKGLCKLLSCTKAIRTE
jgi:hypothetical protein